jgi:hypothetical protein
MKTHLCALFDLETGSVNEQLELDSLTKSFIDPSLIIISFTISLLHNKLILLLHIVLVAMYQNCLLYFSTFQVYSV